MIKITIVPGIKGRILLIKDNKVLTDKDSDTYYDAKNKTLLYGRLIEMIDKIKESAQQQEESIIFNILTENYLPYEGKLEKEIRFKMLGAIKTKLIILGLNYNEFRNMDIVYKFKKPHRREKDNRKLFLQLNYPEYNELENEPLLLYSTLLKLGEL